MTTEQMARTEMGKVERDLKTVESRYGEDVLQLSDRLRLLSRPMRVEEGMDLAHRQGNPLFGSFQGNMLTSTPEATLFSMVPHSTRIP